MKNEVWREVVGFEGWYSVSSLGRIRREMDSRRSKQGLVLKPGLKKDGYLMVSLQRNSIAKSFNVHRIVAHAFLGERPIDFQINHKDLNKLNNTPSNLEYCSKSCNIRHAFKNGAFPSRKGERNIRAKLNNKAIIDIKKNYISRKTPLRVFSKKYGVTLATIHKVLVGRSWNQN